jgi:RNA polymerase sigma factor (sigma-70 family)
MDYTKLSDNDLVSLSATGDGLAFEALVRRHSPLVMGLALARLGDRDRSKDIVQDTFLRVFRKLGDYSRKAKFSTWLYRIASNLIKDNHKYARRHPVTPLTTEHVAMDFRSGRSIARVDEGLRGMEKRAMVMEAARCSGPALRTHCGNHALLARYCEVTRKQGQDEVQGCLRKAFYQTEVEVVS